MMNPHEDHQAEQRAASEGLLRRVSVPRIARVPDGICERCRGWWLDCGGCETTEDREPGWDDVQEDREAGRWPRLYGGYIPSGH